MLFSELLEQAGINPSARGGEAEITKICADSRNCDSQTLFVAINGVNVDGHKFIPQAVANGTAAVLCQDASNLPADLPYAVVEDSHRAIALLGQALYGHPAKKLKVIGITGTNGKSTITHLLHAALNSMEIPTAKLGTITYETGKRSIPARMTCPDPLDIAELTAEMVDAGVSDLVMEVSSHAIDQQRVAGINFDVAIFTNLTGDHLDYHKTMEEYFNVKARLFKSLAETSFAVINRDDPYADELANKTQAQVIFYGLSPLANVRGCIRNIDANGTDFELYIDGEKLCDAHTPLIGRHNLFNILASVAACKAMNIPIEKALAACCEVDSIPGRLERVATNDNFNVFVDYAHTDDALLNVLGSLQPITPNEITVVFGCGGDRDRTKRPRMAKIAQSFADNIIVTSDNPRNEDPEQIFNDIMSGFDPENSKRVELHPDRKEAIFQAIAQAKDGDIVLIAGKGHETYQLIKGQRNHFDDVEQAREAIRARQGEKS